MTCHFCSNMNVIVFKVDEGKLLELCPIHHDRIFFQMIAKIAELWK